MANDREQRSTSTGESSTQGSATTGTTGLAGDLQAQHGAVGTSMMGAQGQPNTIYRDPLPGAAGASAAPAHDPFLFTLALAVPDKAAAIRHWGQMSVAEKKAVIPVTIRMALEVIGPDAMKTIMKDAAYDFTRDKMLSEKVMTFDAATWMQPMHDAGQWNSFIKAEPRHNTLTQEQATKLHSWVKGSVGSLPDTKALFEKVYPRLHGTPLFPGWEKATAWTAAEIERLYSIIVTHMPVGHVQTLTGGFYHLTDSKTDNKWSPVGGAWYNGAPYYRVVFGTGQVSDDLAGKGWTGHDGVGGSNSQDNADTKDKSTAVNPLDHYENGVLHEVGHGVGERMGGNAWALAQPWVKWEAVKMDVWASGLWDPAISTAPAATDKLASGRAIPKVTAEQVQHFFAVGIKGKTPSPPHGITPDDWADYVSRFHKGQPLLNYWMAVLGAGGADNAYKADEPTKIRGNKAFTYLTRWSNQFATYSQDAHTNKVSWYSVSSPLEWFAEQYTQYYRTNKGPLSGTGVKDYFDKLDTQGFDPSKQKVTGGGTSPGASAGAGGPGGAAAAAKDPSPPRGVPWP